MKNHNDYNYQHTEEHEECGDFEGDQNDMKGLKLGLAQKAVTSKWCRKTSTTYTKKEKKETRTIMVPYAERNTEHSAWEKQVDPDEEARKAAKEN